MILQSISIGSVLSPETPWQVAYPKVEQCARMILKCDAAPLTTAELARAMWGPGKIPARLFQALKALAKHSMTDCVTKGDPSLNCFGKTIQRNLWQASTPSVADGMDARQRAEAEALALDLQDDETIELDAPV